MIMWNENTGEKWTEYISEVYGGERPGLMSNTDNCDGPAILELELLDSLKRTKRRNET